ncbi:MAG: hypothetical protein ACQEP8_02995 [Chlamydiota bacterium]
MKRWLFVFLVLCFGTLGAVDQLNLLEELKHAQQGDYFVALQDKSYLVWHVNYVSKEYLIMDEIMVPEKDFPGGSWNNWILLGADRHTSWVIYRIDLHDGGFKSCFSKTQGHWLEVSQLDAFFSKLLRLNFKPTPDKERRRIGPPPSGGIDMRSYWQPKRVLEGQVVKGAKFGAWQAVWPADGSELAEREIEIYLPQDRTQSLAYLPYWIQVQHAFGRVVFRIIDSGRISYN